MSLQDGDQGAAVERATLDTIIDQTRTAIASAQAGLSALVAHAQQSEAELRAALEQAALASRELAPPFDMVAGAVGKVPFG